MGEYANYNGKEIKIGICESMYYLRADQADTVEWKSGNVNPMSEQDRKVIRFRFPFPDEDRVPPGGKEFHDNGYERAIPVYGLELLGVEFDHDPVQFTARGYVLSIPCPEKDTPQGMSCEVNGITVHRNGFPGRFAVTAQGYRGGNLAVIMKCGGCGAMFNLPTWKDAEPVVVALRSQADKETRTGGRPDFWNKIADRIAAGYSEANAERRAS